MVIAAVFQYLTAMPLPLAANIVAHAVETEFEIVGLQAAARMFAAEGQRGKRGRGAEGNGIDGGEILRTKSRVWRACIPS